MSSPYKRRAAAFAALVAFGGPALPPGARASDNVSCATEEAGTSPAPQAVIVELTTPPSALTRSAPAPSMALAQRTRVRRAMLDLEGRERAARGLSAPKAADVVRHEYRVVANGFAAVLLPETILQLASDPDVKRIVADGRVEAILDVSVPHIRAPEAWTDFVYQGAGTTIAILDTGVDYTHADLGGCLGAGCKVIGGYDFINDDADPMDDHGHGTHVAATAAGDGALDGVAPDARVLAYKVLGQQGSGPWGAVIAGIERAADPDGNGDPSDHATIISMSLGGPGDEDDPVSLAVDAATAAGVLSVIAAGNNHRYFTIGSPGTARTALTIGATDDVDDVAFFSSRGPTLVASLLKPEITAPGVAICAARLPSAYEERQCVDAAHAELSGTSMATPHAAGAAALLLGLNPGLTPVEAKAILQQAAVPVGLDATTGGAGRLDARAALDVESVLSPAPINLGIDDGAGATWERTATVTVRNLSAAAKTYTLAFDDSGLPPGVSALIVPEEALVPADGSGEISLTLTVDHAQIPASTTPPYLYTGRLVASAPGDEQAALVSFALRPPLANDLCENATNVGAGGLGASVLAVNATTSIDDPDMECGCDVNAKSLWYRVTPTESGTLHVDTAGSGYPTVLGIFSGECGALHRIACDDIEDGQASRLSVEVRAGKSYYVEVASYCAATAGLLYLDFEVPGPRQPLVEPLTEVFQTNIADLAGTRLIFTPDGPSYSVCLEFAEIYPTDPTGGTPLALTGDSFTSIALAGGQTVGLYGQQYDELFVGSNGYVTFTAGETGHGPSFASHFALPAIAPFSADYIVGPLNDGEVSWKQVADRVAVTWDDIQSFEPDELFAYPYNRIQLELLFDGQIRMTFLETGWHGLTGLSPGGGAPTFFPMSNFLAVPHCRAPALGEVPLAGQRLQLRDKVGDPDATKLKLVLAGPDPALLPQLGSAADPTLHGASFEIFNPSTGEFVTAPLPEAGWTAFPSSSGGTMYLYRDREAAFGPCTAVDATERRVRAKCGGVALGFTLNEFGQRKLAASLTFGATSAGRRFCSVFGGTIRKDLPHIFVAKKAAIPDRCWLPESYYP